MRHIIVYSSDFHGNELQFQKAVNLAKKMSAKSLIIGGDIAPKDFPKSEFLSGQRRFLEKELPRLLRPLQDFNCQAYLMMGNDDFSANMDVLEANESLYCLIHGKRLELTRDFDIVGYAYVPITPFQIKDWEKFDLSSASADVSEAYRKRKRTNYRYDGFKSANHDIEPFVFLPKMEQLDSIQHDLAQRLYRQKPDRTVYVIHSPPNNTALDMVGPGTHVGSFAVREFIEQTQPYLTLHGHIHETVDVSSSFKDHIGSTLCMTAGNYNTRQTLNALIFDVYDPESAQRFTI